MLSRRVPLRAACRSEEGSNMEFPPKNLPDASQRGAALITAIFAILLGTLLGVALHYLALSSLTVAVNDRDNTEALYLADAGIAHATALIGRVNKSQYSTVLSRGANPAPNTGDELSVPPSTGLWTTSESIPAGNASGGGVTNFGAGGGGRYWVAVGNDTATGETSTTDNNGVLVITSTGLGRSGASATVEVTVSMQTFPAILINGKARVRGNLSVNGSSGIMHANDTLDLNGSPCADQYFSSSGNILNPGNSKGAGCVGVGVSRVNQQIIQPPIYNIRNDFYSRADYILGSSGSRAGKIYSFTGPAGSEKMIYNTNSSSGVWQVGSSKWTWKPDIKEWSHNGDELPPGTYYSEGNMDVKGSFGSASSPVSATFVAEGYIDLGGSKASIVPDYDNYFLVAGTDAYLKGNLLSIVGDLDVQGIVYAHHQIEFSGSARINGVVIAANQADTKSPGCLCNPVPLDNGFMNFSGSPTVIYNGGLFGGGASILGWREVRY